MSAEGTPQPPPEGSSKPAVPPPKKQFISAIIDKSSSSKKVLPKIVRRRPGAGAGAAATRPAAKPTPTPTPTATSTERPAEKPTEEVPPPAPTAQPAEEPTESTAQPAEKPAHEVPPPTRTSQPAEPAAPQPATEQAQLPTPVATQEPVQNEEVQTTRTAPPAALPPEPAPAVPAPPKKQYISAIIDKSSSSKKVLPKIVRRRPGAAAATAVRPVAKPTPTPTVSPPTGPRDALEHPDANGSPRPQQTEHEATSFTADRIEAQNTPPLDNQPTGVNSGPDPTRAEPSVPHPVSTAQAPSTPASQPPPTTRSPAQPPTETPVEDQAQPSPEIEAPQWATVNRPRRAKDTQTARQPVEEEDEDDDFFEDLNVLRGTAANPRASASKRTAQKTKAPARGKRQAARATRNRNADTVQSDDAAEGEGEEDLVAESPAKRQRRTEAPAREVRQAARATRKRNADTVQDDDAVEEDTVAEPPAKKPRRTRKDAGTARPKKVSKKKATGSTTENGEQTESVPKRRGRVRIPTPDPENLEAIDPAKVFLGDLTSDVKRFGPLSAREQKMRQINWAEVREKRRQYEAESRDVTWRTKNEQRINEELEQAENERLARQRGPQYEMVDGQIVMREVVIDEGAEADAAIQVMEITEDDDLTRRVTNRNFMQNNRRYPKEFMLPGQGKQWTREGTDYFYHALQMFGTDFMMISTMFPGTTRKSIKTKFNREEKANPERIKEALAAPRNTDWQEYLEASGKDQSAFVDPDAIKRELEEEEAQYRIKIEEAKKKREEELRQMRLAGVEIPGEGEADTSGNGGKKKGKKNKEKPAPFFPDEEGVEIVGLIDDD